MTIDFDAIIDRRNTHSVKWDDIDTRQGVSHPCLLYTSPSPRD